MQKKAEITNSEVLPNKKSDSSDAKMEDQILIKGVKEGEVKQRNRTIK